MEVAWKLPVIFEKKQVLTEKKICSGSHNRCYYDNKVESTAESLKSLVS